MNDTVRGQSSKRPVMIYDGDCSFCKRWVERWRVMTGDGVEYIPSSEGRVRFPEVPEGDWEASVQYVEVDGTRTQRADAVFRALAVGNWLGRAGHWAYERVPGFGVVADAGYDFVARNRGVFSKFS